MKRYALTLVALLSLSSAAFAQAPDGKSSGNGATPASTIPAPPPITANSTPVELARAALAAQGGDKFKNLKSVALFGSVDLYAPTQTVALPGKFALVTAGAKMRLDVDASPAFKFKQIYDGQQSYSSIPGVQTPPADKFGLAVLVKYDQPGYTVSAVPNDK
jgi:hypothetical protein